MAGENLTEKVSVNVNSSTLSEIDLLVDNGYYSNRSDFINQALRESLREQQMTISRIVAKQQKAAKHAENNWFLGVFGVTNSMLKDMQQTGEQSPINGYGVLILGDELDREMLYASVTEITVRGRVIAPKDIKEHYGIK